MTSAGKVPAGDGQGEDDAGFTGSTWFCALVGLSVVAHVQVVAFETDYGCTHFDCTVEDRLPWYAFDHVFTVLFLADVCLSILDVGPIAYFRGDPLVDKLGFSIFNCTDVLVVLLRMLDVWALGPAGIETGLRLVSLLRVVHVVRFTRCMRLMPAFRELWLVVAGMKDTLKVVAWVGVLLVPLIWVYAAGVTILVGKEDASHFDFRRSAWSRDDYWGDVPRSMYSLFQVLTGDGWSDSLSLPLIKRYPWLVLVFSSFRCLAVLVLLNTIVGVVVETTLTSAVANEERRAKEKEKTEAMVMESLREIFKDADTDKSGQLDMDELVEVMKRPGVRDRMKMLEIPTKDLYWLHGQLDEDQSGLIKTDTFFRGCSKLRGPAMAMDLQHMSVDLGRHIAVADSNIKATSNANATLAALLQHMGAVDVDIVKGEGDEKDPILAARRARQSRARGARGPELDTRTQQASAARERPAASEPAWPVPGQGPGAADSNGRFTRPLVAPAPPPLPRHLAK